MAAKKDTAQGAKHPAAKRDIPHALKGAAARGGGANGKKPTVSLPSLKFMAD